MLNIYDNSIINWKGWKTDWASLRLSGWEITIKPSYDNWRQPFHSAASHTKVYIRHPENKMIGRITWEEDSIDYELDFIIQEKNQRITQPQVLIQRNLTIDDIPKLMEIILELQKINKRKINKPRDLRQAEIYLLNQRS